MSATAQVTRGAPDTADFSRTFKHQTSLINGVRLFYVTGGKGPPPVLLHGLPATWYERRPILPQLAGRYTVIAPHTRGLGDSSKPAAGDDTHTAAEDVHQLVRSLGFDRVYVAGHDWGAAVGFAYAVRYRTEVRRLAILDMNPWFRCGRRRPIYEAGRPWHTIFYMVPDVPEALITGRERQYLSIFYSGLYGVGDNPAAIGTEEIASFGISWTGKERAIQLVNDIERGKSLSPGHEFDGTSAADVTKAESLKNLNGLGVRTFTSPTSMEARIRRSNRNIGLLPPSSRGLCVRVSSGRFPRRAWNMRPS